LNSRQKFSATIPEIIAKKEEEKHTINQLENLIRQNPYFITLPGFKKKDIFNTGRAKEKGWKEIISESGLDKNFHNANWEFYSNYAHSEQIEAMQLKALFLNPKEFNSNIHHTIICTMPYDAMLIYELQKEFPAIQDVYKKLPSELIHKIEIWNIFGISCKLPN